MSFLKQINEQSMEGKALLGAFGIMRNTTRNWRDSEQGAADLEMTLLTDEDLLEHCLLQYEHDQVKWQEARTLETMSAEDNKVYNLIKADKVSSLIKPIKLFQRLKKQSLVTGKTMLDTWTTLSNILYKD